MQHNTTEKVPDMVDSMEQNAEVSFSLMDLANTNTDGVRTLLTRLPSSGLYTFELLDVKGSQGEPDENGRAGLIRYKFDYKTLDVKPIDKKIDPLTLIDRQLSESYTLWPSAMEEMIGLLKGRYQKAGIPNLGNMGGVEGGAPGWLDGGVGRIIQVRVYTFMNKGQERVGFDWVGGNPAEAAEAETATA